MPEYYADLAAMLEERLSLDLPPVALTLVSEQPAGIARFEERLPSACSFWRRAEHGTFYASAEDHLNCPIGAMVMGFELPEATTSELMGLVQQMCSISYIKPEEVPHIPKFDKQATGIVYGPLAQFPLRPDVAIVWATPQQAMVLQEAVGAAEWSDSPAGVVLGRPACGVLPAATARGKPTVSLGCAGMRTFTDILPDRLLIAIPGAALDSLSDQLSATGDANDQMLEFYRGRKAAMRL
jgi:uncharacterized protein (DUF169 family)